MPHSTPRDMTGHLPTHLALSTDGGSQQRKTGPTSRRRYRLYLHPGLPCIQDHLDTRVQLPPPWPPCSWRRTPSEARVPTPTSSETPTRSSLLTRSPPPSPSRRASHSNRTSPPSAPRQAPHRALRRAPPRRWRSRHHQHPAGTPPEQRTTEYHCWHWTRRRSRRFQRQEPGRGGRAPPTSAALGAAASTKALAPPRSGTIWEK